MEYHKRPEADIRLKYQLLTELGMAISLTIFVITFIVSKQFDVEVTVRDYVPDEIQVEEIERTIQQKAIPKPSRPSIEVAAEDEDVAEDEELEFADDDAWDIAPPPPPPMAQEEEVVDFFAIEEQPQLIGGTKALYKAVKYPEMAQRAGVEGLAQIRFIVSKDGTTRGFEVMGERPEGLGFGDAAIAALQKVRFKPGKQRDKFVPVRMSQVIKFELN
jgi:periplasmic protein TonB